MIHWLVECWQGFRWSLTGLSVGESVGRALVALAAWALVIGVAQKVLSP